MSDVNHSALRLLVVDDDAVSRKLLEKVLRDSGYTDIVTTASAEAAIEALEKEEFSLLICDVMMPELTGLELLPLVRKAGNSYADIPIVMISSTQELEVVQQCLRAGADDYILKPPTPAAVKNVWASVWKKNRDLLLAKELLSEKQKNEHKDKELDTLRHTISELKTTVSRAIDTPISIITRSIVEIEASLGPDDKAKEAVRGILSRLYCTDLYQPEVAKRLDSKDMGDKYLLMELGLPSEKTKHQEPEAVQWGLVKGEKQDELMQQLRSYTMDVWAPSTDDLLRYLIFMFEDFDLFERCKVEKKKMQALLLKVRANYDSRNPYHNFVHAFDVTRNLYSYLTTGNAASFLSHFEILALLLSGLLHDVGHPGLNNTYLVKTKHALALRYNDKSVLENYHCSSGFALMSSRNCEVLENLSDEDYATVRACIISSILATDLVRHSEIVTRFQGAVAQSFQRDDKSHRSLLMQMLIKAADIGNPSMPFEVAKAWAEKVQEEFFLQGDLERSQGMPITAFMDKENANISKMQTGFLGFFVIPLYTILSDFLPGMGECLATAKENVEKWNKFGAAT